VDIDGQEGRGGAGRLRGLVVVGVILVVGALLMATLGPVHRPVADAANTHRTHGATRPYIVLSTSPGPGRTGSRRVPNLVAFRGLGTWVDIYDDAAWGNPLRAVAVMRARGVRTLYLQTSNYNRHRAMVFPGRTGEFIDAAHKAGMFVVAWYLPDFADVPRDLRRVETALKFRSASGGMFDAFGLDIEAPIVASATVRTRRLLSLADSIRNQAGPAYPLGAIIPSPRGMRVHADYWPGFPFRALTRDFDVDLPMTYFTWRVHGMVATHWYTTQNVKIIRAETAPLVVPIHVIGGLSTNATKDETRGFVEAVRERGVLGASYYEFGTTTANQWAVLRGVPANPVEPNPLPVAAGTPTAFGWIPSADHNHPQEVFYWTPAWTGPQVLRFRVYDVQAGEVAVVVNWHRLQLAAPTRNARWSWLRTVPVPPSTCMRQART
jgi:hypothetical protein